MNNNTEIKIKDFRAVHKADIVLNGITVIAGVNGSGKSTISKILRSAFDNTNDLDSIYFDRYYKSIRSITEIYRQINSVFPEIASTRTFTSCLLSNDKRYIGRDLLKKALGILRNALMHSDDSANRILNIIEYNLHTEGTLDEKLNAVLEALDRTEDILRKNLRERPLKHLDETVAAEFNEDTLLDKITITEYGVPFYGKNVTKIPILHYIKDTTYIDSPLTLNFADNGYPYNDEKGHNLFMRLRAKDTNVFDKETYYYISKHITKGEPYLSEDIDEFRYLRADGAVFSLQDCATGIKAFAILQLLLRNGYINDRSLIIIDEPEAHLHPQWIVEYAKVIVELNKKVGAKFFIATHSTDMVSALRYISEKEEMLERLAFYNAVPTKENPYKFNYEVLGADIEPIFASFNKSFDLIERYGADNGV